MQIKEARGIYQNQIQSYRKTASELRQKQKELEKKIKETPNGKVVYENEAVSLELSLNAVEKKQNGNCLSLPLPMSRCLYRRSSRPIP